MSMKKTVASVFCIAVAIFAAIICLHQYPVTKPIAEVLGAPGALVGLVFVGDGHDIVQVLAVVLGEFVWCLMLAVGIRAAIRYLRQRYGRGE